MKKILTLLFVSILFTCSSDSDSDSDSEDPNNVTCNTPTALSASNIDDTTADLAWSSSEANATFEIQYGISGFTVGNGQSATSNTTSFNLNNLTEGTDYQFYVRANCGSGSVSQWSNAANFTTTEDIVVTDCQVPQAGSADQITESSAALFWFITGDDISQWEIEYGLAGFSLGSGTSVTTTSTGYPLNGLTSNTDYEYYVRSICSPTNVSLYHGPVAFTTLAPCVTPTNLSLNQVGHCAIDFDFNSNGETAWEIEYGESGFALGSGTVIGTSSIFNSITDLNPATTYEIYVRANCGSEGFSEYSDALVVTTSTLGFIGNYLIEEITAIGADGPVLSDGTIVSLVETSPTGRSFSTQNFPNFCTGTTDFTFSLSCNNLVIVDDNDSICACGGNYIFGPATNPSSYDPNDDNEFELTFTDDVNNDCGDSRQVTYRFTKQ